ncbi:hypothetical protein JW835_05450 [bacterium]|nr:hypothetical protein [bacterium]
MKHFKLLLLFLLFVFIHCDNPAESEKFADIFGEVSMYTGNTIEYSGRVEMQYNGNVQSYPLVSPHQEDGFNIYNWQFEDIEIAKDNEAFFFLKLMNESGAETVYADTSLCLKEGGTFISFFIN